MRRIGNLWPQLTNWDHLLDSALAAARGKRRRPDVARFLFHLEPNVCELRRELLAGTWRPGPYRTFWIRDPKPRMISAAPFRDRVVHHALTRVLEPVFEPRFAACSFASRKGFGQHRALRKARAACARYRYALKCDIRKYFPSMDHLILKELLEQAVKCKPTLALAAAIIDGSIDFTDVRGRIAGWLGHASFGDTWRLRRKLFRSFILMGAERGRIARRLVEQQFQERPRLEPEQERANEPEQQHRVSVCGGWGNQPEPGLSWKPRARVSTSGPRS